MDISQIHPMLVHFPIVMLILALGVYSFMLVTGKDLAARACLSYTGAALLAGGLIAAIAAAAFGDMALDAAIDKGFAKDPLEEHEELAGTTIMIFAVLAVGMLGAIWKKFKLTGVKALVFVVAMLAGTGMLLNTAYHGGELVYKEGVNVEKVKPQPQPAAAAGDASQH